MKEACSQDANIFNFYTHGEACHDPDTCTVTDAECWTKRCASLDDIPWGDDYYGADVWKEPHGE